MAILESMILGTPVIATDNYGSIELIGNNDYGVKCENSDKGLYEAMKMVLIDDSLRNYYVDKAVKRAQMFDEQSLLIKLENIL